MKRCTRRALPFLLLWFVSGLFPLAWAQNSQGIKLVGADSATFSGLGFSVALSADGTTAIAGGASDNNSTGAVWVFTGAGSVWSQQGAKLVPQDGMGQSQFGNSVALSADGNTAVIGGYGDGNTGAAWVFTRIGGAWNQQGNKLIGAGAQGNAYQGSSVAISADGNTVLVGGYGDSGLKGAVWVFTNNNGVWTQQGDKLVGSGATGSASQGAAVAISGDASTALIGGYGDNSYIGATWAFVQSGGVWTQQGSKLIGSGSLGMPFQGLSVALSYDGNTALVGAPGRLGNDPGAVFPFARSGGAWTQVGKLVGTGGIGPQNQGWSVGLSSDGSTAIIGGRTDSTNAGAAWVFTQSVGLWSQLGNKLVGTGAVGIAEQGYSVAVSGDSSTLLIGGPFDSGSQGAAWIYSSTQGVTIYPLSGTLQAALINSTFATNMQALVLDGQGNSLPNVTVTFTAPNGGASGTFPAGFLSAIAVTDADGIATAPNFVANGTVGSYNVVATAPGAATAVVFTLSNVTGTLHPAFFTGEVSITDTIYYLQFPGNGNLFGYYTYQYFPWLYHYDMGFEYFLDALDGQSGAYLYDSTTGHWLYTSPSFAFPYLYDFTLHALLYYYPNASSAGHYSSHPRYFFNFTTNQIFTM